MDKAHKQTDKILAKMELHLTGIYKRASEEIQETADKYFEKFKKQDEKKLKLLKAGKITEQEYKSWRKSKIMFNEHYKNMQDNITAQILNVNETAIAYVNDELPDVYTINYNFLSDSVDGINGYSFTLTDTSTIKNLATSEKTLLPYKIVDGKKDVRWNTKKINSEVLQGILQGESMNKIAERLKNVTEMNYNSAIRNARTSVTSAECKGRQDSYKQAEKDGIILKKEWISTNDRRTRHVHRLLDGQQVETDKPFKSELGDIMYPGDPHAHPANVYN